MTLSTLLINFTIVAIILTALIGLVMKKQKSWLMTYLQCFAGVWYIFSGWVKAIDPLGMAYKIEQYFGEFESTFEGTWMSFIAPMFPALANVSIYFSVFVIILEIVLGLALLIGAKPKLTAKVFLGLLVFFTFLTGFTYLTGYVGQGVNFFEFSKWGAYDPNNMKVTDCGCFGDFIKLEPLTSFTKDVFLLIPALYFVFKAEDMHQLFNSKVRTGMVVGSTLLLFVYCISNYVWDLPHTDFRPFKVGTNLAEQREAELNALGSVQIQAWKLQNKEDGSVVELPNNVYMKEYKSYPKDTWEVIDQVKSEPTIKPTKISEMEFSSMEGYDLTDEMMENPEYSFLIVAHKLNVKGKPRLQMVKDSIFSKDTIKMEGGEIEPKIVERLVEVKEKEVKTTEFNWNEDYLGDFQKIVAPLATKASKKGIKTYIVAGGADQTTLNSLESKIKAGATYLTADDILLKTIVRSNPGIVLLKEGKIVNKWHKSKFPGFENCGI